MATQLEPCVISPVKASSYARWNGIRRSSIFDSATDHFQRRPINGVFPLEDEPDISVFFHREHAGAVFNLNELVSRFGAVWKDDAIFAKPHQTPLMNIPAGH